VPFDEGTPPPPPPPPPPGGDGGPGDGSSDDPDGEIKVVLALDCAIKDEQALTNDLWLVNVGTGELPAGLKVRYDIPATGDHGAFGEECRVEIIV
jgi:hypothetical protein